MFELEKYKTKKERSESEKQVAADWILKTYGVNIQNLPQPMPELMVAFHYEGASAAFMTYIASLQIDSNETSA